MAVLNTTPDSFYDGGKYSGEDALRARIDQLLEEGADLVDVGAESTRPGAELISAELQVERAGPAIEYAVAQGACVSIDTTLPAVAKEALRLGAAVVNDVSCLADAELARVAAAADADLILMHSRGEMRQMKGFSEYESDGYEDVVQDVSAEWEAARARAVKAGLKGERIWFDPGLGFHKNAEQSHDLLARLKEFDRLGTEVVLGASRKSFLASLDGSKATERLGGSIAAALAGLEAGVGIVRVHDVQATRQAVLATRSWSARRKLAENAAISSDPRLKCGDRDA